MSPAPVSNNHLPSITGLKLISIKGRASSLQITSLISSMSLHARFTQVCLIMLMMEGSARLPSGGFGGIAGFLIFVAWLRLSLGASEEPCLSFLIENIFLSFLALH